jgi:hypothetical protein
LKLGRKSETGREKRVTPEFGERKEEKILPPNSGCYNPSQPRFPQLLAPLKQSYTSGKGKGGRKRSPQEEIPSPPSSAARPAPENSILWVSTQGTKLQ